MSSISGVRSNGCWTESGQRFRVTGGCQGRDRERRKHLEENGVRRMMRGQENRLCFSRLQTEELTTEGQVYIAGINGHVRR